MTAFTLHSAAGTPLITAEPYDGLIILTVNTKPPGQSADIAPSDARELASALLRIANQLDNAN
jgi:hypothetical protein